MLECQVNGSVTDMMNTIGSTSLFKMKEQKNALAEEKTLQAPITTDR